MITIRANNGSDHTFAEPPTVEEALSVFFPSKRVFGALRGGKVLSLNERLTEDCTLRPLTYQEDEGRRIYERTLRFVFLVAMNRLYPGREARFLNSVGYAQFVSLTEGAMPHGMAAAIEGEMRSLIRQNMPIRQRVYTVAEMEAYYQKAGREESARLLRHREGDTVTVCCAEDLRLEMGGVMLPSAGYIHAFDILPHMPGLMLMMPSPGQPEKPAAYTSHQKFLRNFTLSRQWCDILGVRTAADVNDLIGNGEYRDFIRVNEALHSQQLSNIAEEIVLRQARIVMIFGPSSSGKTTSANRLCVHLRLFGKKPHLISLDNFYRSRARIPRGEDGEPDFECIEALDTDLLMNTLEGLLIGEEMAIPEYDFTTGESRPGAVKLRLGPEDMLVLEGIHGMNDILQRQIPEQLSYGVFVSALPCINLDNHRRIRTTDVRLIRRIVRDSRYRGTPARETIAMWPKVRAGEEKWIFPNQEKADAIFNTSLHYEIPFLKKLSWDVLRAIPGEAPEYAVAQRLLTLMEPFLLPGEDAIHEVPPLSILREFIGDCTFYDKH